MPNAILAFASYLFSALLLLAVFVWVYVRCTPYREFALIAQNNNAAAIALSGAVLGFSLPLASSIYYTQSLLEMTLWASVTCLVQLCVFMVLRRQAAHIEAGHTAPAILLATLSLAVGLLNAVCISH
jgi:putative membrane protein